MKIAIVGAGNAGCITALHFHKFLSKETDDFEIEIYHSPTEHPIEKVGQGTILTVSKLIGTTIDTDFYNNKIGATIKTGILYENWGKKQDKIFHPFLLGDAAIHLVPVSYTHLTLPTKRIV